MTLGRFRVSQRGQIVLPAAVRRRWQLEGGGGVEIADPGDALLLVPERLGGVRGLLRAAIAEAGGYAGLAREAVADDPELR